MVSIIPAERSPWDVISKQIGSNISQNLPGAVQQGYNRGQLQNSLDQIKQMSQNPETKPLDIMLAAMKAGAGIPGSERYLGAIIPELMKVAEAKKSQGVSLPGEGMEAPGMQQQLPEFMQRPGQPQQNQPNQNFPTNIGPQEQIGNLPQPATTGQIRPILDRNQMIPAAKQLAKERTDAGIPTTVPAALEEIKALQEENKAHNKLVEEERKQRVGSQREYGKIAVDELHKVYKNSTPEMDAIFKKKGEEAAASGQSESEIDRYLATEAKNFANSISNVEKDLSAPRLQNKIQRAFLGTNKDFEQSAADLRTKLKPILDEGLYDTARNLLSDLGYYPEERETIVNPMSERQKTMMNQVPNAVKKFKDVQRFGHEFVYTPQDKQNVKEGLTNLKKADPNFSLVLGRKAFEDKNYDWRLYKDALNELESEGFELTDDQKIQRSHLDTPPLNLLEKALHGVGIIGR